MAFRQLTLETYANMHGLLRPLVNCKNKRCTFSTVRCQPWGNIHAYKNTKASMVTVQFLTVHMDVLNDWMFNSITVASSMSISLASSSWKSPWCTHGLLRPLVETLNYLKLSDATFLVFGVNLGQTWTLPRTQRQAWNLSSLYAA